MGILQLLTVSISELTPKFHCKNCLYPPGSVEHTTQWLLSLLPCQGAANQSHTFCSDMVPWEPHEGPAQWPCRWAPAKLPMVSSWPMCLSHPATAKTALPVLTWQQQLPENIPDTALRNLLHPTPLPASDGKADLFTRAERRGNEAAPLLQHKHLLHSPVLGSTSPSLQLLSPPSPF